MAGQAQAVLSGQTLEDAVVELAEQLGLRAERQKKCGRRVWGAERKIDIVLTDPETRKRIGIECKAQSSSGSAEEKIPTTIKDIEAWPIPGIVVISGDGFSQNMTGYMLSTGKVVELYDLEDWLKLFFGIPQSFMQSMMLFIQALD